MRALPPGLQAHLDSGATTLCHCWKLATRGGEAMGFTNHDRTLSFDGVSFEPEAGFTATEIDSSLGLSVDNLEAAGALSSVNLSEERLAAGDFDNAEIDVWLVNWQEVSQRLLLRRGALGEVTRGKSFFTAELRGLAHALNQPQGRIFQYGCDAVLGDQRCGIDLDAPAFSVTATVTAAADNRHLTVSGAASFAENFLARGTAVFMSGANLGRMAEIKFHRARAAGHLVELWQPMPFAVTPGDQVKLRAGCDKQFATCRAKFSNGVNFRGFPHIPGSDFVLGYVSKGDPANDGSSRND